MPTEAEIKIFGIRHHGPGSARSLRTALEEWQPDALLVEGPPDAAEVLHLIREAGMEPPVALLIYRPDQPQRAVYYPFAVYSPEWQALNYGLEQNIAVRFMDLPQAFQLGDLTEAEIAALLPAEAPAEETPTEEESEESETAPENDLLAFNQGDPISWLAKAAGYEDSERWWEHMVEQRQDNTDLFAAILEAMTALRESGLPGLEARETQREVRREAYMRQTIRQAQRDGFQKIAVVCGAWHGPALAKLAELDPVEDAAALKNLAKVTVQSTWVPWTYSRLSFASGYGAGIESPGWYRHLWTHPNRTALYWITRIAKLLRDEDLDISTAHVIETVRLAESLAAVRDRPVPALPEFNEAVLSVITGGNEAPLQLIHKKLIVGEGLGQVPASAPTVALQQDVTREQKRLRLPAEAVQKNMDFDLRKPTDLERSILLHRLNLLGIDWGQPVRSGGGSGTFHELWQLQWQPDFAIRIIEKAIWGNTVYDAVTSFVESKAREAATLPALTELLDRTLLAELPVAINYLMTRLQNEAALANDIANLMDALPPLANVLRYGNVRQVNREVVAEIVEGLVARISVGLPPACVSLNDEAAAQMYERINKVNTAVNLLEKAELRQEWQATLTTLADQHQLHGILAGRCCRILLDSGVWDQEEAARRFSLALSRATEPAQAAAWVEGFIKGSAALLLHGESLWQVIDEWLSSLNADAFIALLPLLRRTFATFTKVERYQMGEKARKGKQTAGHSKVEAARDFDQVQADKALAVVKQLLGLA